MKIVSKKAITLSWPMRADPHITHSLVRKGEAVQSSSLCIGEGEFISSVSEDGLQNSKRGHQKTQSGIAKQSHV